MPRSLKKGPYIDPKLQKKVDATAEAKKKQVIKTWSRRTTESTDISKLNKDRHITEEVNEGL